MGEWQPIETAPQDGTTVVVRGQYAERETMLAAAAQFRDGIWWRDNDGYGFTVSCKPTHWVRLPILPHCNPLSKEKR